MGYKAHDLDVFHRAIGISRSIGKTIEAVMNLQIGLRRSGWTMLGKEADEGLLEFCRDDSSSGATLRKH